MPSSILPADLEFLVQLAVVPSLSAAGRELGVSKAAVSKRLAQIEGRAGVGLISRNTRRMSLTPEGAVVVERARRILADIDELDQLLAHSKERPKGLLRVNATLGLGRSHVAPLISRFVARHPEVEVRLQLTVHPPALTDDAFDVCVRFGAPPEARVVARRLAANRRLLCASPSYLERYGVPKTPEDLLKQHRCISIRQGDETFGTWRLSTGRGARERSFTVKTHGALSTNDGEIAVNWALDGHGILMRAQWDIAKHLQSGRLVQVLPQWRTPEADIYAVVPKALYKALRVRAFIQALAADLSDRASALG